MHVQDGGTGIHDADLPHIFETFFTTKSEGTGLGLAVSYRIAREHGGWLGVVTEQGRGSTFTLYLPSMRDSGRKASDFCGGTKRAGATARRSGPSRDERVRRARRASSRAARGTCCASALVAGICGRAGEALLDAREKPPRRLGRYAVTRR